ncbi:hypothetical protein [Nocardia yamanashiensis]|uniref:hypothetical protein n=1 Tax=Nocardia yamanashiensis TaxID=209247 RepID=UPI00083557D0|nr:hypothetical protein [Nocardia yamanashiensis]
MLLQYFRRPGIDEMNRVVDALELPEAVFKTCPWQPRELVETGLRQWLRCCGAAMRDDRVIGMPSYAVDEAWHGLILCTLRYQRFCEATYGKFLHHFPAGETLRGAGDSMADQLGRTVVAWSLVMRPGERCVLWELDSLVGVPDPWGIPADRVELIEAALREQ